MISSAALLILTYVLILTQRVNRAVVALLAGTAEQRIELRTREHAQDDQDATGTCEPRLEYLVRIHQEVLAHRRHAGRGERAGGAVQVLERAVETLGLGEDRDRRGAGAGIGADARRHVLLGSAQRTLRG